MALPASAQRRAERRRRRTRSPLAHIPWRIVENNLPAMTVLSPEELDKLHEASMRIVEEIGIAFMDDEALDLWAAAGAAVDRSTQRVRIDRGLLLELTAKAPSSFTWRARNPARHVPIGSNHIAFAPNGGTIFAQDLEKGRRPGIMADYNNFLRLMQMCNAIHFTGDQLVTPHDVPVSHRHLQRSYSAFTLTDKAYMEAPHGRIISADAVEMAKIVFQEDVTRSHEPVLGGVVNASSPLRYDERMLGGMITFGRANQVLIITPFILAGAMSPITMAAAVAQQNAEALAGIAFVQVVRPGAPVLYGGFATNIDMKTGGPAFGTPEGAWAMAAGAQLARRYGLPYRGSGSLNTSKAPDAQSVYETMWSIWPAVMAHTNFVMHSVGWLEAGLTASFEKVIIDMESLAMFSYFFQGQEISDETLALDMIAQVGPGGHHFGTPHTHARYSTEFYTPILADRQNYETWALNGAQDAATRAHGIWKRLLADYAAPPMAVEIQEALQEFVARRGQELMGVELYG
ncbi:MAG: trimethylamine methyltransferase family protein [Caldilineaceae bacterium]|nr:trimethylamine methyltransferase family protein [Caldilineaceae bacterium]